MRTQKAMVVLSFLRKNPRCSVPDVAAVFDMTEDEVCEIARSNGIRIRGLEESR